MKHWLLILILFIMQTTLCGCALLRDIGNKIGEDIGQVSDELGGEKRIGEGEGAIVIHPQDDKKIKMAF